MSRSSWRLRSRRGRCDLVLEAQEENGAEGPVFSQYRESERQFLMWTALGEQYFLICRSVKAAPMYVAADVSNPGAGDGSVAAEPTWRFDCLQFGEIEVADYL